MDGQKAQSIESATCIEGAQIDFEPEPDGNAYQEQPIFNSLPTSMVDSIVQTITNCEEERGGIFGFILYYKHPLWNLWGAQAANSARRLSLGNNYPQRHWPGRWVQNAAIWDHQDGQGAQGPPLRDWALVQILPAPGGGGAVPLSPSQVTGPNELLNQIWVRTIDISMCVDASGFGNLVGGGWDPGANYQVSSAGTLFQVPEEFVIGRYLDHFRANVAKVAEFQRQAAIAAGGGGRRLPENHIPCPLDTDENYNMCDFWSSTEKQETINNLVRSACADITFDDNPQSSQVQGTCSPLCKEMMKRWWDGGESQSWNCDCEYKGWYDDTKLKPDSYQNSITDWHRYSNIYDLCMRDEPNATNYACPHPIPGTCAIEEKTCRDRIADYCPPTWWLDRHMSDDSSHQTCNTCTGIYQPVMRRNGCTSRDVDTYCDSAEGNCLTEFNMNQQSNNDTYCGLYYEKNDCVGDEERDCCWRSEDRTNGRYCFPSRSHGGKRGTTNLCVDTPHQ